MTTEEFALAAAEDRIFTLELALSNIGGALLAPGSWEDDQRLHQYMYDTARRALVRTGFGDALDQREQQLFVREATPVVNEPAHQTEPVPAPAPVAVPDVVSPVTPEVAPEPAAMTAETPLLASDNSASSNGPRDYGWPTQP
ncbi:MAG TPA: hypothetical protein VGK92_02400 [Gaiellales bacterium]|jgi:hypothetical protein